MSAEFGLAQGFDTFYAGGGDSPKDNPDIAASLIQQWPFRLLQIQREYSGRRGVVELYDEVADPREMRDLSREHPERVQELQKMEALMRTGAPDFGAGQEVEIDPDLRRRLETLGYIEK